MDASERWRVKMEVTRDGDAYTAWSEQLPGVYGEGGTEDEAIESFWEFVDFMRDEMAVPAWPHSREGWSEVFPELAGLDDDSPDDFAPESWAGDEPE
ncbi:MAG TPA: hypothetical protein VF746_15510 [Longimicrobium sp.]|jgi:hypothetical protein